MKSTLQSGSVVVAAVALVIGVSVVQAQPIVQYSFPASWDGTGTTVTDLSGAGNNGHTAGTPALSATIPPGADPATQSLDSHNGGIQTDATGLLANSALEGPGGFRFEVSFWWDGTPDELPVQKIIDYAGTEFLQLENVDQGAGTADLRFGFNDEAGLGPILSINANQWYDVVATFDTQGNTVVAGDLAGLATMVVNGGAPISVALTKTGFGDGLNRPIGIGAFSIGSGILELNGLIHDPTVSLLPEPASLLLLGLAGLLMVRRRAV